MGPQRQNWTFPFLGQDLIEKCKEQEAELVAFIDEKVDEEQLYERDLAEYREKLRVAGVIGWESIQLPKPSGSYSGTRGDTARSRYGKAAKALEEYKRYRTALEHDVLRDPHRQYKLTYDDLTFFGYN